MRGSSLAASAAALLLLFSTSLASADDVNTPPVVVVEVTGDRFDAARLRARIGKELAATAVAPDDPRAATATGRVALASKNGERSLTATYRKMDAPVTRTIEIASDATKAEDDAVFLVGNLARDEASDLVPAKPAPPKPPPPKQPTARAPTPFADAETRDLEQLRSFLYEAQENEHSMRMGWGIAAMGFGAALLTPSIYFYAAKDPSDAAKTFRANGAGIGGGFLVGGLLMLFIENDAHEPIARLLRAKESQGAAPADTLYTVESAWAKRAAELHAARKTAGAVLLVSGSILVAATATVQVALGPHHDDFDFAPTGYGLGGFFMLYGASRLFLETSVESNYRVWRTVKSEPAVDGRPSTSFGIAPIRGGAAASFSLQF